MTGIIQRLSAGDILKGAVVNIVHPTMIEVLCHSGADFLFIDFEHGLRDYGDIADALVAADASGVPALVRVGERSSNLVARMLDSGAAGLLFPQVSTAEEAAELVSWCRYKPVGVRGSGFSRAAIRHGAANEYARRQAANYDVACIMIVESLEGKANLAAILAVDGVTGVAVGPGDLSLALGISEWDDPKVTELVDDMSNMVRSFPGKALLRLALTPEEAPGLVAAGANMILLTHDVHLLGALYAGLFDRIDRSIGAATPR